MLTCRTPGAVSWVRRTFSALWVRNFRLFFAGQLVSNTGNALTPAVDALSQ